MRTNSGSPGRPAPRAREHPSPRAAIAVWLVVALANLLCLVLLPSRAGHVAPTLVLAWSGLSLAWAALGGAALAAGPPNHRRFAFLYPVAMLAGILLMAASVAATGGASSPLGPCNTLIVIYVALLLPRRAGIALVAVAVASDLLPLLYGHDALAGRALAATLVHTGVAAVAGVMVMLVCRRLSLALADEAERLETVAALHREVEQSEFDVVEVVLGVLDRARTLLGASAASAGILEGDEIVYRYRTGPGRHSGTVIRTPKDASLSGICLRSGEPAFCEDSELDPRTDKTACRAQGLRSMIIVPLRHRSKVVGVLNINSPEPRAFAPGDVATVQLIGGAISAAYGHATDIAAKQLLLSELEGTVSELRATERKLSHQASHDPLTGLPNRTFFLERLEHALEQPGQGDAAVLFVDLDGFKRINDTFGHATGDALLIGAAERIRDSLRGEDIAARLGGDEFAVMCTGPSSEAASQRVVEALLTVLSAPFWIDGRDVFITASVGIATGGGPPDVLLREADVAMYHAKTTGKHRCATFRPEMLGEAGPRMESEDAVRGYSPIIPLVSDVSRAR
jgi:diguanylate cyclase (GGDEF)-like protein